jgi:Spy/CpxP family protein refolding chaperone
MVTAFAAPVHRHAALVCALLSAALAYLSVMPACLAQDATHSAPAAAAPAQPPVLDARTRKFAAALHLTDQQQTELARILAVQRERMRQVWQQQNVPPEYRAGETRAIKDKTEEQIRAILTDEQKKKYFGQRPAESPQASQPELDHWFKAAPSH